MKSKLGAELIQAMQESLAHQKKTESAREVVRMISQAPVFKGPKIVKLRVRLGLSQSSLAKILCVSPKTVQSWEQGLRKPNRSIHRLLQIIEKKPEAILKMLIQ